MRANLLVQEACFIAEELERHTEYRVTLQIPSDNLNANRKVSPTHRHVDTRSQTQAAISTAHSLNTCVCVFVEGRSAQ